MKLFQTGVCVFGFVALLSLTSSALDLASASGRLIPDAPAVNAVKVQDGKTIRLVIKDAAGKKLFESELLGSEEKVFTLNGKATSLAVHDLTGDGVPEVVAAAFYGPRASGMFVFSYDPAAKKFVTIPCTYPKQKLTRNMLVSDMQAKNGSDMIIGADKTVTMLGLVYPDKAGKKPTLAAYSFAFKDGSFVHQKTQPLLSK